jgi:hypothetical protein
MRAVLAACAALIAACGEGPEPPLAPANVDGGLVAPDAGLASDAAAGVDGSVDPVDGGSGGGPDAGPDSGVDGADGGLIADDAGAGSDAAIVAGSYLVTLDLSTPRPPDPLAVSVRLRFIQPGVAGPEVRLERSVLRFTDGAEVELVFTPDRYVPPPGITEVTFTRPMGSDSDLIDPGRYCGTPASLRLPLSTGMVLAADTVVLCTS